MENICNLNWSWYKIRVPPDNLQYFTQNFAENTEVLFCHLNEIEPQFLAEKDETDEDEDKVLDPRNNTPIKNFIINSNKSHATIKAPDIFPNFPTKSTLTRKQHLEGLRILNANQNKTEPALNDVKGFNQTTALRSKEYNLFGNFLKAHFSANFKEISDIGKELCQLFQQYLQEKSKIFLQHPDNLYSLQTALPLQYDFRGTLPNLKSKIVFSSGLIAVYTKENDKFFEFKKYQEILKDSLLQSLQRDSSYKFSIEENSIELDTTYDIILPETTLFTLLNALSNDLDAWEIPVTIEEKSGCDSFSENNKFLKFNNPLPQRVFSMKNAGVIYEYLLECHIKLSKQTSWWDLSSGNLKAKNDDNSCDEIDAIDLNQPYKLLPIEKYISSMENLGKCTNDELSSKKNMILIEWNLSSNQSDLIRPLKILTKRNILFCEKHESEINFLNMSLKLDYKRRFGAEIMTKSELIKEWIKQFLIPNSVTDRVRIDAKTFEPILQQRLNQSDTEADFFRLHNIKPVELLNHLYGFLTTLLNFPSGEYLLKCDPKHKDKIMVFSKTLNRTDNALSIHRLYNDAGNVSCTNDVECVPIDNCVVLPMHNYHSVLPSCFPHWGIRHQVGFNDRKNILQKVESVKANKLAQKTHLIKLKKQKRKNLKKQMKRRSIAEKKKNEKAILKDIEGYSCEIASENMIKFNAKDFKRCEQKLEKEECAVFDLKKYLADANASISNCVNEELIENKNTVLEKTRKKVKK